AAVVPALIVWGWVVGVARPARPKALAFVISWAVLGALFLALRTAVLRSSPGFFELAPVFVGAGPLAIRLTGIAGFADVARLLVFPLNLRAAYSPAERTLVDAVLDGRLLLGLACRAVWAALVGLAWRRGRRGGARGVGWIGSALLPVA